MTELVNRKTVAGTGVPGPKRLTIRHLPLRRSFNVLGLLAVAVGLALWQILAVQADNFLFPSLSAVVEAFWDSLRDGSLLEALQITLLKGLVGLLLGVAAALVLGRVMATSTVLTASLAPLISGVFPIPRLAMYPLMVVALGAGGQAAIALVAIEAFFPMLYSVQLGASSVTQRYRWLMSNVGASFGQREALVLRAMTPSVVAGLRNAVPTVLVVVVVTELVMGGSGTGFLVRDAGSQFEPARALAVVVALGIVGVMLNVLVKKLFERTQPWSLSLQS
ncbi:ABC transporter permease subunit [Streptomyces tuirus]|uniref:ABC transporter permease subunit n=1 Tax=Streptomyces tuirus TaxID=68278 RepID=A0A941FHS5_9ACTN|nr:ABC transporter permease subunit [Streptomyces tuirus]